MTAQGGFLTTTTASAGRALVGAWRQGGWRPVGVGLAAGLLLVAVSPFVAAIIALVVAAVGIGLWEGDLRGTARTVLCTGLGLLAPALIAVIARMAGLL